MSYNAPKSSQLTTKINSINVILKYKEEFLERLQGRFHTITQRLMELDHSKAFTIFINILDKSNEKTQEKIIFGGLNTQKKILDVRVKKSSKKDLWENEPVEYYWDLLNKYETSISKPQAGGRCIKKFIDGELVLEDMNVKNLRGYFPIDDQGVLDKSKCNPLQKIEYPIFKAYFNLKKSSYLTLPIIAFANIEGAVHILFEGDINKKSPFRDKSNKRILTKTYSTIYENLLLDWDIYEDNIHRPSFINLDLKDLQTKSDENPLLSRLLFTDYYNRAFDYFQLKQNNLNKVPQTILEQYRKTAIMSILIDSYAHNISAHSLTSLGWMFKERGKKVNKAKLKNHSLIHFKGFYDPNAHLSIEAYNILKYLAEKGAFWNGLTRSSYFGGSTSSFYTIFWKDLIQNSLYLGTIAHSEGIHRINFDITIYEAVETKNEGMKRLRTIKKKDGELLTGIFAYVDLDKTNPENAGKEISEFCFKGEKYEALEKDLIRANIFFSGGVIGKHAFFTIIENEIRNVKHYTDPDIRTHMQHNGLTIGISIEEHTYRENEIYKGDKNSDKEKELWKVGIWIKHPIRIDKNLITKRFETIAKDIMTDEFIPRLGGSFQDKICTAMLFNGAFISVQRRDFERDKVYYPWIKTGCSKFVEDSEKLKTVEDWEFSWRRLSEKKFESSQSYYKNFQTIEKGYLKKFILLWRGQPILNIRDDSYNYDLKNNWENSGRFTFVNIPNTEQNQTEKELAIKLKREGIIRIISKDTTNLKYVDAYLSWFKFWFPDIPNCSILFESLKGSISGEIIYDGTTITFKNAQERNNSLLALIGRKLKIIRKTEFKIPFAHGGSNYNTSKESNVCRYRSHGVLNYYFLKNTPFEQAEMKSEKVAELMETLLTKICIFDNRIAKRFMDVPNPTIHKKNLFCSIKMEEKKYWQAVKNAGFFNYHFLVIHLSFIETFTNDKGIKVYSEKNINSFIVQEILQGKEVPPLNFVLVIITGRGRTEWWENLDEKYKSFVTFRSVEMLTNAIEQGVSMNDDFEMKYRLIKVLFGS